MSVQGIFNTTGLKTTQDLTKLSFSQMITRLMPNGTAPLFAMTSYLPDETAVQTEHGYFAKTALFPYVVLSAGVSATDTDWPVDSTENVVPGMIFQVNNTNRENILVEAVLSNTSMRVRRAVGGSAASALADVAAYMVGNAYEEASIRPIPLNITPRRITNLTQIFRNSWAISDTVRATQVIAGDTTEAESRQDCAAMHAQSIEAALFWGKKYSGIRNGQPFRTMDGLINIVSDIANYPDSYTVPNVWNAGATTNYTQLEGFLDPVFNQTTDPKVANERVMFVGGKARTIINNIGRFSGNYEIMNGETTFGLQFGSFKTSRGTFKMIEHPLFNSNPVWSATAVVVDLSSIRLAYLNGRKTQNKEFNSEGKTAQDFGVDAVGGTLTTEMTLLVKNPPANAIITGFTAAAKEA